MEFTTFRLKDTEYTRVSKTIHNKQTVFEVITSHKQTLKIPSHGKNQYVRSDDGRLVQSIYFCKMVHAISFLHRSSYTNHILYSVQARS